MTPRSREPDPLVSVVIPTYGRPETLLEALDSVAAQTYDSIEVVVVDDHSPEPVEPRIREHDPAVERLRCLRHEENNGANAARNTGIRAANGEFIAFLDDDDIWKETVLERAVAVFARSDPSVGVVYTGSVYIDDGEEIGSYVPEVSGDVLTDLFCGRRIAPFSNLVVRREVIDDAGLLDEELPSLQDREWYFRLAQHCAFEPVRAPLVVHRAAHTERISSDFESKRDVSYPRIVQRHRSLAADHGWYYERRFLASLSKTLGAAAVQAGHYRDAVNFLLRSLRYYPLSIDAYLYFLAAVGGGYTHRPALYLKQKLNRS